MVVSIDFAFNPLSVGKEAIFPLESSNCKEQMFNI